MTRIDVNYTGGYENLFALKKGNRALFSTMKISNEEFLLKVFKRCSEEKIKVVDRLLDLSYNGIHVFPVGKVYVHGRDEGYLCHYYMAAVDFSDALSLFFPYNLKYQATFDTSSQLRFLHQNGFIANDIRLNNNILSCSSHHGMMVDFEDMILEDDYVKKGASYRFYDEKREVLPSSKWDDAKKQFICNTSLLTGINFESIVISKSQAEFLSYFHFDKEVYDFSSSLFENEEIHYFDEIAPKFQDEEKVNYYVKQLKI